MMPFPISGASPIRFPGPPPAACDVVVIGGGVVGVMTAWFLADKGLRVVLCEKGRIAGEQSSRNWGWVRQQGRDPDELPIMVESLRIWKSLAQEMGEGLGFRQTGVMYLANTDRDLESFEAWMPHAAAHGLDTRMLARCEVDAALGTSAAWKGAIQTASDARAEPWTAVPLLVQGAIARGVTVAEACAVRALDLAAGRGCGRDHRTGPHCLFRGGGGGWRMVAAVSGRAWRVDPAVVGPRLGRGQRTDARGFCGRGLRRRVCLSQAGRRGVFAGPGGRARLFHRP